MVEEVVGLQAARPINPRKTAVNPARTLRILVTPMHPWFRTEEYRSPDVTGCARGFCYRAQRLNAPSTGFVVEIEGLRKHFGSVVAVKDLSLRIPRGGVFGLLGPNGSGKTTTIGLMLGLIKPTSGSIRLFGQDVRHSHLPALQRVGAMVESPAFYPDLSGRANLRFFQGKIGRAHV